MQVFHGSDVKIEKIELAKCEYFRDFGRGFYVTNIREHAYLRAIDIAQRNNSGKPVVTEFNYAEVYPITVGLNTKKFDAVSKEWIEFIILNRNRRISHPAHTYDIVEGPIANDRVEDEESRSIIDDISKNILEAMVADYEITESSAIKIFYSSKTYELLSYTETLLWQKSWQTIYEAFREEAGNITTMNQADILR